MARFNVQNTVVAGMTTEQMQAALTSAQQAYVQLVSGVRIATVSYDGKSVSYRSSDISQLGAFIGLLQRALGINFGRRAIRPIFR